MSQKVDRRTGYGMYQALDQSLDWIGVRHHDLNRLEGGLSLCTSLKVFLATLSSFRLHLPSTDESIMSDIYTVNGISIMLSYCGDILYSLHWDPTNLP